jgi:hypothetical protein
MVSVAMQHQLCCIYANVKPARVILDKARRLCQAACDYDG